MIRRDRSLRLRTIILGATLLAYPCEVFAQHGGGGGHVGGGVAGGGGLSGGNHASGVDQKDDLKDFHQVLAVQATSEQIIAYVAMLKTTATASTELQGLTGQLGKEGNASEVGSRAAALAQAIEKARSENKKFMDGFSDAQKSGLKEISKRLVKEDSDLAQQAKALDAVVEGKVVGPQATSSAQSLEHALTIFQHEQLDLGEEMSIGAANNRQDVAFNLPPVKNSIRFANQPIEIVTSGVVSKGVAEGGQNTFKLELTADLSDLQHEITEVLRGGLDKADRCGEQIAIRNAALTPAAPASLVVVQLHFERWACFGKGPGSEMAEGNASIEVKLTPAVSEDGRLRLVPEMGRIDAEGMVGELLRSGSLGEVLRDKVTETLLSIVRQGGDFKTALPPAALGYATLQRAQFDGTGSGKLTVVLDGEIRVSDEKATSLTSELKERSASQETIQKNVVEALPR
ncbi:MAG: hypothetical protein WAM86_19285 [Candidatus Sulfotelmatobacter sp.]|jgi:hypothetical protein